MNRGLMTSRDRNRCGAPTTSTAWVYNVFLPNTPPLHPQAIAEDSKNSVQRQLLERELTQCPETTHVIPQAPVIKSSEMDCLTA